MADNFREQIDFAKEALRLEQERAAASNRNVKTLKDRAKILSEMVESEDDLNKLTNIQKDILSKVNSLNKQGKTITANRYKNEQKIITNKVAELKLQKQANKLLQTAKDSVSEIDNAFGNVGASISGFLTNPLTIATALLATFEAQQRVIADQFGGIGVTEFRQELEKSNRQFVSVGLTSENAQRSISDLANSFGIGVIEAAKLSNNVARISASTGMSVDDSTKLVGLFTQTQGLTGQQAENLLLGARQLAKANNVAPDKVLSDVATNTGLFARFSQDGGENILRAAVQARKLGIELSSVASAADGLLNFQDSINAEVEASILLGRNLNLQKARELSLANDLEGLQSEIVKQVGSEAEFNALNRIQRDALSKALGLNVEDIQKLVSQQNEQKTLQGEINRLSAENEIPEDTITATAKILNDFKSLGLELAGSIGPSIARLVEGVGSFIKGLDETVGLLPLVSGLLAGIVVKNTAAAISASALAYFNAAGTLGPGALAAFAAAPAVLGGIAALITGFATPAGDMFSANGKTLVSPSEGGLFSLSPNDDFVAGPGVAGMVAGGGGGNIMELKRETELVKTEISKLRQEMSSYFGVGGSAIRGIGSRVGDTLKSM